MTEWVMFTKRTNDPKLSWLEMKLDAANIPHRRNGESTWAPILEVPKDQEDAAWELLPLKIDDMRDDHPKFERELARAGWEVPEEDSEPFEPFDPVRMGWVGKDGRP